jgi:hypothetical protein
MKHYLFYRESNNFNDILQDKVIKKYIDHIIQWKNYLRIAVEDVFESKVNIHITLKYGDELRNNLTKDFTPIPYKDYIPKK